MGTFWLDERHAYERQATRCYGDGLFEREHRQCSQRCATKPFARGVWRHHLNHWDACILCGALVVPSGDSTSERIRAAFAEAICRTFCNHVSWLRLFWAAPSVSTTSHVCGYATGFVHPTARFLCFQCPFLQLLRYPGWSRVAKAFWLRKFRHTDWAP